MGGGPSMHHRPPMRDGSRTERQEIEFVGSREGLSTGAIKHHAAGCEGTSLVAARECVSRS